ncbi:MAG: T9SS type A sorting domain-containing protein [Bacteroidota bacterium]
MKKLIALFLVITWCSISKDVLAQQKIFYSDIFNQKISIADIDGSNVEVVITTDNPNFNLPSGIYLDEDNQKLYYSIDFSGESIWRANYDGTDAEVLIDGLDEGNGVAVVDVMLMTATSGVRNERASVRIFPNPTSRYLGLEIEGMQNNITLTILSLEGKLILERDLSNETLQTINIGSLASGLYFLRLRDEIGSSYSQKLIIEK